ncbi:MAG: DNA mismatch repair endonuclease MutL [Gemmatimonadetes bacterium]|nr:DNA mismatch repair endonuclease MutL [Gemmatimonadota bacterium]
MARRIQVLPDAVANQIAAGEVVERPASVVKELVENALDAGAKRIEVVMERGGKRRMRVSDDGCGMGREDALLCLDRHATSKIAAAADLEGVRTFGFRGEALPSIAAVSHVTLETREGDVAGGGEPGTRVVVEGGRIVSVDDIARQRGTTVEVRNLFYNAPARAKFSKAVAAETRAVSEAVTALALANPRVGFELVSDERTLLDLPAVGDAGARIAQVWGGEQVSTLVEAGGSVSGFDLGGLVQRPDAAKPGVRRAYLFVNGRPFRAAGLLRAADRGYRTTIPHAARPWVFLYLRVPGGEVDVNVHPTKAEVRFRDQALVEQLVEDVVRGALEGADSSATLDREVGMPRLVVRDRPLPASSQWPTAPPSPAAASPGRSTSSAASAAAAAASSVAPAAPSSSTPSAAARHQRASPDSQMALFVSGAAEPSGAAEVAADGAPALPAGRPRLWQVLDTYVLAETRDGILIIDQHSAHERILFQRLMDAFAAGGQHGQRLLFPLTLRLTAPEVALLGDLEGLFRRVGFEVEPFGGDTVIVQAVPNPHPWFDAERALREMVHELTHGSELVRSAKNQHERIAMTFACKSAIKAGQRLSDAEMQRLFDQLFATELPHHDVHGRPTIVRLSARELSRKFGRT